MGLHPAARPQRGLIDSPKKPFVVGRAIETKAKESVRCQAQEVTSLCPPGAEGLSSLGAIFLSVPLFPLDLVFLYVHFSRSPYPSSAGLTCVHSSADRFIPGMCSAVAPEHSRTLQNTTSEHCFCKDVFHEDLVALLSVIRQKCVCVRLFLSLSFSFSFSLSLPLSLPPSLCFSLTFPLFFSSYLFF